LDECFAFYPGCLVLQRMPEYEVASRAVLAVLGIELELVQRPVCCGSPIVESFSADWLYLGAYNLALVEQMGLQTVVTVCGGCTNALSRAAQALEAPSLRDEANRRLEPWGLSLQGRVAVRHLVHLLSEREEAIRARIVRKLSLRVAITNPCQIFRPGTVMGFDEPARPQSIRRLAQLAGAQVVEYGAEEECCAATLHLADADLALVAGRRRLESMEDGAVMIHACGNCHLLLHRFQQLMIGDGAALRRHSLFLPQLLGLAMGLPPEGLGLREETWS
jgi:heterodisulfide reductase subunit B